MPSNITSRARRASALPLLVATAEVARYTTVRAIDSRLLAYFTQIRCSGFEANADGRCSNCMKFNQNCIFTPKSATNRAFVPAHTVWRGVGQPPPMYGAYGQPLPLASCAVPYGQPWRQPQYLPRPTAEPYPAHYDNILISASPHRAGPYVPAGSKRLHFKPHAPTLPPPYPGLASLDPGRSAGQFPHSQALGVAGAHATPFDGAPSQLV
jgi:hypothetical protein